MSVARIDPYALKFDESKSILDAPRPIRWADLAPGSFIAIVMDEDYIVPRVFLGLDAFGVPRGYTPDRSHSRDGVIPLIDAKNYVLLWDASDE